MRVRSAALALAAISCLALLAVPARAVVHIRVDQVGYEPAARKLAIVTGTAGDHPAAFALVNVATGAVVLR
ncbi:MAG: cellulase N-terminal Ig-like domain-containing protein, partial [Terriglobales bacterium]